MRAHDIDNPEPSMVIGVETALFRANSESDRMATSISYAGHNLCSKSRPQGLTTRPSMNNNGPRGMAASPMASLSSSPRFGSSSYFQSNSPPYNLGKF